MFFSVKPAKHSTLYAKQFFSLARKKTTQSINDFFDILFIDKYLSEEHEKLRYDF